MTKQTSETNKQQMNTKVFKLINKWIQINANDIYNLYLTYITQVYLCELHLSVCVSVCTLMERESCY